MIMSKFADKNSIRTIRRFRNRANAQPAFTLVELLVALTVSSVILSAVAALAYTATSADDVSDAMAQMNTTARATQLRISDLIRKSRLIGGAPSDDIVVWANDDGYAGVGVADNAINPGELVFLEVLADRINIVTYIPKSWAQLWFESKAFTIDNIKTGYAKSEIVKRCYRHEVAILSQATNLTCTLNSSPPYTRRLTFSFDLNAGGITRNYQFTAGLRGYSRHLIDNFGEIATPDDD